MIKFGVQLGGGSSREKIQPMHIALNKIFKESKNRYFETIETFGIYFRVAGPIRNFGDEGPDNLEYLEKGKELGIDYVIPESVWRQNNSEKLIIYFVDAIRQCFGILLEDANRRKFVKDEMNLVEDFNIMLKKFIAVCCAN